jgi:ribosome recycling factor
MSGQYEQLQGHCQKTVEHFKRDLSKMRSGRAQTGLVENVMVDYYGTSVPLIQLGMINTPEPRLLTIQVYDANAVASVEKAIMQSDLGLNPSRDGNLIRLLIPALTDERRKELVKKLHKLAEEARVSMRNHRRDAIDLLKKQEKDKEITEDQLHRGQTEIQKITDKFISEIDSLLEVKEKEMLEV